MRRGLVRAGAWAAATAAAVSVSWFGVHRVLAQDSADQPSALVVAVADPTPVPVPPPPTSIGTPVETPSAAPSPTPDTAPASAPSGSGARPQQPVTRAAPSATEKVTSFTRPGGLIVVAMGPTSAHLITATPDPGWSVHTWTSQPTWLRVDFEKPDGTDSIFYVTWNGHPPMVQT